MTQLRERSTRALTRCPFCHDDLSARQATTICDECHAPHHAACWSELDHCASCRTTLGSLAPDPGPRCAAAGCEERALGRDAIEPKHCRAHGLARCGWAGVGVGLAIWSFFFAAQVLSPTDSIPGVLLYPWWAFVAIGVGLLGKAHWLLWRREVRD